jgi:hypothetical protein
MFPVSLRAMKNNVATTDVVVLVGNAKQTKAASWAIVNCPVSLIVSPTRNAATMVVVVFAVSARALCPCAT